MIILGIDLGHWMMYSFEFLIFGNCFFAILRKIYYSTPTGKEELRLKKEEEERKEAERIRIANLPENIIRTIEVPAVIVKLNNINKGINGSSSSSTTEDLFISGKYNTNTNLDIWQDFHTSILLEREEDGKREEYFCDQNELAWYKEGDKVMIIKKGSYSKGFKTISLERIIPKKDKETV